MAGALKESDQGQQVTTGQRGGQETRPHGVVHMGRRGLEFIARATGRVSRKRSVG